MSAKRVSRRLSKWAAAVVQAVRFAKPKAWARGPVLNGLVFAPRPGNRS